MSTTKIQGTLQMGDQKATYELLLDHGTPRTILECGYEGERRSIFLASNPDERDEIGRLLRSEDRNMVAAVFYLLRNEYIQRPKMRLLGFNFQYRAPEVQLVWR